MQKVADRLSGATLALLLQAGFALLLFQSVHLLTARPKAVRELTLIVPRLAPQPSAPAPPRPSRAPTLALPGLVEPALPPPSTAAPQTGLQGFGQSLFGCTPDKILAVTPEQRSHCPKPGERAQQSEEDELLNPRSRSKDAALWQEGMDERNWAPTECQGNMAFVIECQTQAMHEERMRRDKAYSDIAVARAKNNPSPPKLPDIPVRRGR